MAHREHPEIESLNLRGPGSRPADDLMEVVYDQLSRIAASYLRHESGDNMLEPALLVNETYLRLAQSPPDTWKNVEHFLAVAAKAMRKVLIDHARRRKTLKRGFGRARVSMELVTVTGPKQVDVQTLDEVLHKLAEQDPQAAQAVELRFFAGLTHDQAAAVMDVSRKTAVKYWTRARDWLAEELADMPEMSG